MSTTARRLFVCAAGVLLAIGCDSAGNGATAPRTRPIAGTYDGTTSGGGTVTWTLSQTDTAITGSGTFLPLGPDSVVATYSIRGTMRLDQLAVRLVGAPGDADADSVVYFGQYEGELRDAVAFSGLVTPGGHSPLAGALEIVRRDTTP